MIRIVHVVIVALILGFATGCGGGGSTLQAMPALSFTSVTSGLASPTAIAHAGDGSGRLFVAEQGGTVRIVNSSGTLLPTPFLDISGLLVSGGEQGLLGLAFPPNYSGKGYFYVHYTRAADGAIVVSRFFVSPSNPDLANATSEQVILVVPHPTNTNHNGGQLAFGPDGMLYVGLGDGGGGGDPSGNAQSKATLLGKVLRLDVEAGVSPYRIPPDNPFVSVPNAMPEIWAFGLRNPWRFSFDRLIGDLYIADVGQDAWEEIDFQAAGAAGGANYGWNVLEGPACYSPAVGCVAPPAYSPPVAYYGHEVVNCAVIGGYVYRGPGNPAMQGLYLYGDYCSGRVWGLRKVGSGWQGALLNQTGFAITSFGEGDTGQLYVADSRTGTIYRIDQK